MKDFAVAIAKAVDDKDVAKNRLREYLQHYLLMLLAQEGFFSYCSFMGGTSLRVLFDLPRFSEDLDFSVVESHGFDFKGVLKRIKGKLALAGYSVEVSFRRVGNVLSAWVKFDGLLCEAGLSPLQGERLAVKIEVDSRPPKGAVSVDYLVNKFFSLLLRGYDLASILAGKINALMRRKYLKGRDVFDILWILSRFKDAEPNFVFLNNAFEQMGWEDEAVSEGNWRRILSDKLSKVDWEVVEKDIGLFVEDKDSAKLLINNWEKVIR